MARPRQITDEAILDGARAFFLTHGPGVSTQAIADSLGVSQAVLFKRFGTKEQLLMAALRSQDIPFVPILEAGPTQAPLREQVVEITTAVVKHLRAIVPCAAMLRASGIDPKLMAAGGHVPPPVRAMAAVTAWVERAKDEGLVSDTCVPSAVASAWLGGAHIRAFTAHIVGDAFTGPPVVQFVEELTDLMVVAMTAKGGAQ